VGSERLVSLSLTPVRCTAPTGQAEHAEITELIVPNYLRVDILPDIDLLSAASVSSGKEGERISRKVLECSNCHDNNRQHRYES